MVLPERFLDLPEPLPRLFLSQDQPFHLLLGRCRFLLHRLFLVLVPLDPLAYDQFVFLCSSPCVLKHIFEGTDLVLEMGDLVLKSLILDLRGRRSVLGQRSGRGGSGGSAELFFEGGDLVFEFVAFCLAVPQSFFIQADGFLLVR